MESVYNDLRIQIIKINQKFIWMPGTYVERLKMRFLKMLQIVCNNHLTSCLNCRSYYMAVLFVIFHGGNEVSIA
jgi:hypothetical protein